MPELLLSSTPIVVMPLPWTVSFGLLGRAAPVRCAGSAAVAGDGLISSTLAPGGGVNENTESATGPKETSLAASSITGAELVGRVDRGAQRHAVVGVEGQLGAADQAAGFLRRDAHGVGGLAGDVGGCGAGDAGVLVEVRDRFFDLRHGGRFVLGLAGRGRVAAAAREPGWRACSGRRCCWRRRRSVTVWPS